VVTAYPLWTDTGLTVHSNDTVNFPATGTWTGGGGAWCGPEGSAGQSEDPFLSTAVDFSLIAFVGPSPYDWGTTNEWVYGNSYFPQGASTTGYFAVTNGTFRTDRAGELWFGFNDDAVYMQTNDNYGSVAGQIQITGP
jgi:hypothetical protein